MDNLSSELVLNGLSSLSPELVARLEPLISIFKTAGILFIIYILYAITAGVLKFRDSFRLKRIEEKLDRVLKLEKAKKHN